MLVCFPRCVYEPSLILIIRNTLELFYDYVIKMQPSFPKPRFRTKIEKLEQGHWVRINYSTVIGPSEVNLSQSLRNWDVFVSSDSRKV